MSLATSGFPNVLDHANLLPMSQELWNGSLFSHFVQVRVLMMKWPGKLSGLSAFSNHGKILFYIKMHHMQGNHGGERVICLPKELSHGFQLTL